MTRTTFPTRRQGEAVTFDHDGLTYRALFNAFPDGEPAGEVFLEAGKVGTTAYQIAKEMAVIFSIARRRGADLATIYNALPKLADGSPAGPMGTALKLAEGGDA